ncbi:sporulation protein YunB [Paenibacillus endoradicis]|uniref:sporulation protein YunB n=1 Tax=Paenibacillus endoradicis TaxID=2972487 RepID=UPI002158A6D9|nr:sporulation protein YunB [Paenibacillus endoradicis]MCR8657838.1 sporulation protein YunB [Paenibacillus endoradicis]
MAKWGKRGILWHVTEFLAVISNSLQLGSSSQTKGWKRKNSIGEWNASAQSNKQMSFKTPKPARRLTGFMPQPVKVHATKQKKKWGFKKIGIVSLVIILLITIPSFIFVERNLRDPLMHVAKIRVKQIATQAINQAITEQVTQQSQTEELIDWKMDSNGKVSGFMLNYSEHMRITSATIETVQNALSDLQQIPERIPIGHAFNSAIISNYGPKIPVTFEPLGAVKVELNTREKDAAINMVLIEVYIKVITEISIIIPFDTEPELVEAEIPISYLLVVGDVPMYYYDSTGKPIGDSAPQAPNISVPLSDGAGISSGKQEEQPQTTLEGNIIETP